MTIMAHFYVGRSRRETSQDGKVGVMGQKYIASESG